MAEELNLTVYLNAPLISSTILFCVFVCEGNVCRNSFFRERSEIKLTTFKLYCLEAHFKHKCYKISTKKNETRGVMCGVVTLTKPELKLTLLQKSALILMNKKLGGCPIPRV